MSLPATRPRIPRDTRWMLIVMVAALASLSVLARVRFRGVPQMTGPIAPVLSQISSRSPFEEMSTSLERLLARLRVGGPLVPIADTFGDGRSFVLGVRFRDQRAVALRPPDDGRVTETWLATDRVTRLAVARVPQGGGLAGSGWTPADPTQPRFLVAVEASMGALVLRPVFVSSLQAMTHPRWAEPVWRMAGSSAVTPGSVLVTIDGALVGMATEAGGSPALVPTSVLLREAERIAADTRVNGDLGIDVQAMTPQIAAAVGVARGVVVTRVGPSGSARSRLAVGDVIVAVDGRAIAAVEEWEAATGRLTAGQTLTLSTQRSSEVSSHVVTAMDARPNIPLALGLELRTIRRTGARVESVAVGSAAEAAGLRSGDVLTLVGTVSAPSAPQALAAFRTAPEDRPLLIGLTREGAASVIAVDRRW